MIKDWWNNGITLKKWYYNCSEYLRMSLTFIFLVSLFLLVGGYKQKISESLMLIALVVSWYAAEIINRPITKYLAKKWEERIEQLKKKEKEKHAEIYIYRFHLGSKH